MRLYLLKIVCMGCTYTEVRAAAHGCDAVVYALDRYPQACSVSAHPLGVAP